MSHNELINAREGSLLVSRTREGNLFTNNATQNQANAGSGSTQGEEVYGNSPPYLGRASAVGFMEEVIETLKPAEALATKPLNRGTAAAEAPESSPSSWFAGNSRDQDSVVLGVDLVLPPRRTADSLLRSYWTGAHPLLPIIHKSSFSARYVGPHRPRLPIIALSHLFTSAVMREFGAAHHLHPKVMEMRARASLSWFSISCSTLYSRSAAGSFPYLARVSFRMTCILGNPFLIAP